MKLIRLRNVFILAIASCFAFIQAAHAAGPIVLDGMFDDWVGRASITDPHGDSANGPTDIKTFAFGTNPGDPNLYFMAERWERAKGTVTYFLYLDMNNNGSYGDPEDRFMAIDYKELPFKSQVDVTLYDGSGNYLQTVTSNADFGQSEQTGGMKVEWGVSTADLAMVPGQTIRMTLQSMDGNTVSDRANEVQWSPADALGWPLLIAILLGGSVWMAYQQKRLGKAGAVA